MSTSGFAEPTHPEPLRLELTGVGPIAGGGLRASDGDREQVSTLLSTAYAEGRITREEHEERLEQVLRARTFDDLVPLTADLVPTGPATTTVVSSNPTYDVAASPGSAQPDKMIAVFGGVERKGKWRVRRRTKAVAVFGGMDLDLRDAIFESPVVEIEGFWCFGGLDIKLPAGMEVRDETAGVFGGTDIRDLGDRVPGAPTLVIKGMTLFGGVSVRGPKPPRRRR